MVQVFQPSRAALDPVIPACERSALAPRRLSVALVGHTASPLLGSEPGLAWNWAKHLARHHNVCLLTHPFYRSQIETNLEACPCPGLSIEWVTSESRFDPWRPGQSERGVRLHYWLWQRAALARVKLVQRHYGFDLAHHVSWGTLHHPPMLWRSGLPMVWGPIGGGQIWPGAFGAYMAGWGISERVRRISVMLSRWNPRIRQAVSEAALIFATNRETRDLILAMGGRDVQMAFDNGIRVEYVGPPRRRSVSRKALQVLWAGRCEPRKGLALAVEAMAAIRDPAIELTVAGDGPTLGACKALARRLQVSDRIRFVGRVGWEQMAELYAQADALLFTRLRDSTGSVVAEAMAKAIPIIALDHQGMVPLVPDDAGVKIPVTSPKQTISAIARAMEHFLIDPDDRARRGEAAWRAVQAYLWDRRATWMAERYQEVAHAHRDL